MYSTILPRHARPRRQQSGPRRQETGPRRQETAIPIYCTIRKARRGDEQTPASRRPYISILYLSQGEPSPYGRPSAPGTRQGSDKSPREVVEDLADSDKSPREVPEDLADSDKSPPDIPEDLADTRGLLTEDSVLRRLAASYCRRQYWVSRAESRIIRLSRSSLVLYWCPCDPPALCPTAPCDSPALCPTAPCDPLALGPPAPNCPLWHLPWCPPAWPPPPHRPWW